MILHKNRHTIKRMPTSASHRITGLLQAWSEGDDAALAELTPLVYAELRKLARGYMRRENRDTTLQTTGLVNECYLRLVDTRVAWQNRAHFFALSGRLMRRILVDFARSRQYAKRGGGAPHVMLSSTNEQPSMSEPGRDLLALDDALTALATIDQRKSRIVELRFFGGFSNEDIAEALGVSAKTVMREWQVARVWLFRELTNTGREEAAQG
jgi:RNA polymerase sigma factor (TIGR02999 family)